MNRQLLQSPDDEGEKSGCGHVMTISACTQNDSCFSLDSHWQYEKMYETSHMSVSANNLLRKG